jgi:hypothetical protein
LLLFAAQFAASFWRSLPLLFTIFTVPVPYGTYLPKLITASVKNLAGDSARSLSRLSDNHFDPEFEFS